MFNNNFCVVIHQEGQLKLINHFKIGGDDQNTYTLLNTCSNAGIVPNVFSLTIAGFDAEQLNWIKTLHRYFADTTILMAPNAGIGTNLNKEFPHHTYAPYFIF
jgi:dihydrodipicolinate reductase